MLRTIAVGFACSASLVACSQSAQVQSGGELAPAAVTPSTADYLPVGTSLTARLDQSLGSGTSSPGQSFTATVVDPLTAQNGAIAVPAGAVLAGHVTGIHNGTLPGDQSVIRLAFDNLSFNGRSYPFAADVASVDVQHQATSSSTARSAVTGAAAGAVLGAIVSGGQLSKVIAGGLLGAAAGTVISLGTGTGEEAVIPAGSTMEVRGTEGVRIR